LEPRSSPFGEKLQVAGTDGATLVGLASLDSSGEHLMDFGGNGFDQFTIASETCLLDGVLDFASNDEDFLDFCHAETLPTIFTTVHEDLL
jgi:hypothetical protein